MFTIKARFINGVLVPSEDLPLKDGEEVSLTVSRRPSLEVAREALKATAGAWADDKEYWGEFKKYIYEARERGSRHSFKP